MELRRHKRVPFQTTIRLKAPGQHRSVPAQLQNLSVRGAFITTAARDAPPEGAEVTCRLALASEGRFVRGRVAWVRPADHRTGVGIEFRALDEADTTLLQMLVEPGREARYPAEVWFDGAKVSVRCEAAAHGRGMRLSHRLPFLVAATPVEVALADQPAAGKRDARLRTASLTASEEDGVPALRVEATLTAQGSVKGTIEVPPPRAPVPLLPVPSTLIDLDPKLVRRDWVGTVLDGLRGALPMVERWWPLAAGAFAGGLLSALWRAL